MKTKTKTNKSKSSRSASNREKSYPAVYLALLLASVLLIEGFLIGAASTNAWQESLQILDVSQGLELVMSETVEVIEPMMTQIQNVETFYQLAATETIQLFDSSYVDPLAFPKTVLSFYDVASVEMASMLDFSNEFSYFPQIAGASISR